MTKIVPEQVKEKLGTLEKAQLQDYRNNLINTAFYITPMVKGKLSLLRLPGQSVLDMGNLIINFLAQSLNCNMYYLAAYHITSMYLCDGVSLSELLTLGHK